MNCKAHILYMVVCQNYIAYLIKVHLYECGIGSILMRVWQASLEHSWIKGFKAAIHWEIKCELLVLCFTQTEYWLIETLNFTEFLWDMVNYWKMVHSSKGTSPYTLNSMNYDGVERN